MVVLLHYQQFLVAGMALVSIWYAALHSQSYAADADAAIHNNIYIAYAPVWFILLLGLYAISSVLYGTATFRNTPEAAQELERQIQEAKREMRRRGIIVAGQKG